jgi:hypothetical protein
LNFKKLFLFSFSIMTFVSCGVKSAPVPPAGTQLPPYPEKYTLGSKKPKPPQKVEKTDGTK